MFIDKLVDFCSKNIGASGSCLDCSSHCRNNCGECLKNIHFYNINKRNYNCSNMIYYYVCKYTYKYASEIHHILNKIDAFKKQNELRILSIGCGPGTELFGFLNKMNYDNDDRQLIFTGIDINKKWELIHNEITKISQYNKNLEVNFLYYDINKALNETKDYNELKSNIVVLNYMISDFQKYNNNIDILIQNIYHLLFKKLETGSIIILNDINHNTMSRDHFANIECLFRKHESISCLKFHFDNKRDFCFQYGTRHESNHIFFKIPRHIKTYFNPWDYCSSAQLAIVKE